MTTSLSGASAIFIFIFSAAALVLPGRSMGDDGKVGGPTSCQLGASVAGARLAYVTSGVSNVSGINVNVVCSIVRDDTTTTTGLSDLEMTVTAPAGGGNFDCTALSEDRNGSPLIAVHRTTSRAGTQVLDWGAAVSVSASKGYYIVNCDVPANGIIHSLFHNER
jgi:hypothetical protein